MKYAIVLYGGKQYPVREGEKILIDSTPSEENSKLTFSQVVMVRDGEKVHIGQPYVKGASVTARVDAQVKGDKLRISKFKAKVRYRRTIGFRPKYTRVEIEKISL